MYVTVKGLVLRVTAYKETDALLTLLTEDLGKITVKARSLRRKNNPLSATCQLLAYGEFTLFEYRGMYTINEASGIMLFSQLHRDIVKLSLGTYFAQVAEALSQEDVPNPELLSLTLNCLYALCKLSASEQQIKSVFELRSACIAGYMPDLNGCYRCGQPIPEMFDIAAGRLECRGCRSAASTGIRLPVSAGVLDAMRYVCFAEQKNILSFRASGETIDMLAQISESYLSTQLERGFSTLDFYKSLLIE